MKINTSIKTDIATNEKTEVLTVTNDKGVIEVVEMTRERAEEIKQAIARLKSDTTNVVLDFACLTYEVRETRGYYLLGYNNFAEYCANVFGKSETYGKTLCSLVTAYGSIKGNKATIPNRDSLKLFSPSALVEIKGFEDFKELGFDKTIEKYGITSTHTQADIRAMKKALLEDAKTEDAKTEDATIILMDYKELLSKIKIIVDSKKADTNKVSDIRKLLEKF